MTLGRLTALAALVGLLCASPVYAQDTEDPEPEVSDQDPDGNVWDRMLAIGITGGLDTPFGVVGGVVEFTPIQNLMIYAGGGVSRSGARVAGGVQLQFPVDSTAFGINAGVAGGPLDWNSNGEENVTISRYWEFALYFHSGFNITYRWDEGLFGRVGLGMEALIAGDVTSCTAGSTSLCDGVVGTEMTDETAAVAARSDLFSPIRAYVSLTVGYAFDI